MNSTPSSLFHRVVTRPEARYASFQSWLNPRLAFLESYIISPQKLFPQLSAIIALKRGDRSVAVSSILLSNWNVRLKLRDGRVRTVSWKFIYRASMFGFGADVFHNVCDGRGMCVVVVQADNGRIAEAYAGAGSSSEYGGFQNVRGFIAKIKEDGNCGELFHRNPSNKGFRRLPSSIENYGPVFGKIRSRYNAYDLAISSNCHDNERSRSVLGGQYGEQGTDKDALFGQEYFRVVDYEVFKIVIE
jgi:hypothetical protein